MIVEEYHNNKDDKDWLKYNWRRVKSQLPVEEQLSKLPNITIKPFFKIERNELVRILKRRSLKKFANKSISKLEFETILNCLRHQTTEFPWLGVKIIIHGVHSYKRGLYHFSDDGIKLLNNEIIFEDFQNIVQNQWWTRSGKGISLFYTVNWKQASSYLDIGNGIHYLYILLGQLGEQLLESITILKLKARMTPAISESKAKEILNIKDDHTDAVYYFRISHGM